MRITYTGPTSLQIPDVRLIVQPGDSVTLPAEVAEQLLARPDWTKAKPEKKTNANPERG